MTNYSSWADVPADLKTRIRPLWGSNAEHVGGVYRLRSLRVADNPDCMTPAQAKRFAAFLFECPAIAECLDGFAYECELVKIGEDTYLLPENVTGYWPHCNLYGLMAADGSIHT